MKSNLACILSIFLALLLNASCTKPDMVQNGPGNVDSTLSYGDSVFYQKNQPGDYTISPSHPLNGKYISFPDGLVIDGNNGTINISKSETGLKYMIAFIPTGNADTLLSFITISGINYMDGFYKLSDGDSIALPIYNAKQGVDIPGLNNGSLFDLGSSCNDQGCSVNTTDARINLAQTVRNGVFGSTPSNNDRHEFEMTYKINDQSHSSTNTLKVKLYYFETMNDVTPEAFDIINSRQGSIIGPNNAVPAVAFSGSPVKPRPPCIFIVGH